MKKLLIGTILALFLPLAAIATELSLVDVPTGEEIGQTGDDPCVIGDSSCGNNQPPSMDWTIISTPSGTWNEASPIYTIGQLLGALGDGGDEISVGIDVNATGNSTETLDYFQVVIDGVIAHFWGDGTTIGVGDGSGTDLADAIDLAQGTGFSDWVLESFSLAGLADSSTIQFFAGMLGTGNGLEEFFLTNDLGDPPTCPDPNNPACDPPTIPEPGILVLFGAGLLGMALGRRRIFS
ncbi:MAG: PEP-CTERM sorting domain-containing protein [Gammaproteobacteria bacterium]|nr:PEP-CTERM sorting domain-containing protein [Gammaproteobacteria bacterium]MDH3767255.1 PEP-CTERM sorting domain-containing protein [Gammaproteobacteria bacterium]